MDYLEPKSIWEVHVDLFKKACRKEDYERAQTIIDNAFAEAEERFELDNRILWCVYSLAACYLSNGCDQQAKLLYEKLTKIKTKILGHNHTNFSDGLERLALMQVKANRPRRMERQSLTNDLPSFSR